MSNHKFKKDISIRHLSQEQIIRYNEGKMKPAEMHLVEKHLLDCEFCNDAVEGFSLLKTPESSVLIESLKEKITTKSGVTKGFIYWRIGIAATFILVMSFGLVLLLNKNVNTKSDTVAQELPSVQKESSPAPIEDASQLKTEEKGTTEADKNVFSENIVANSETESAASYSYKPNNRVLASSNSSISQQNLEVADAEFEPSAPMANATKILSGKVSDPTGEPLAGISVIVKGTEISTITNVNGEYSLIAPISSDSLTFNSIGFKTFTAAVNSKDQKVNARMNYDIAMMDTVSNGRNGYYAAEKKREISPAPTTEIKTAKPHLFNEGGNLQVSGKVLAENGIPLPEVSVMVKGTSSGALTDRDGNYTLSVPESKANLVFSRIGYSTEELAINSSNKKTNVVLNEDKAKLSEVVVTETRKKAGKIKRTEIVAPSPSVGLKEYRKYLAANVKHPSVDNSTKKKEVVLTLVIDEKGTVQNISVKQSLGNAFDEEAIRLVKEGPSWNPGTKDGMATRQSVNVTITFKR